MRLPLRILAVLIAAAACAGELSSVIIKPETAASRVGEWVVLEGTVSDVGQSDGGSVFLNFGGKYPAHLMTVFIPPFLARMTRPESWQLYKGKRVQVDGIVKLHKGKPEIELKQGNFLRLMW